MKPAATSATRIAFERAPAAPEQGARAATSSPSSATWQQLYTAHFDFLWRSLRRLGVPPMHLDDATQDVFLVAVSRLREFEGRSSFKTWLFGIAYHVARRYRERATRFDDFAADALESEADRAGIDPQSAALRSEAMRLVYRILQSMSADKRDTFVMAELEQIPVPEIAEIMRVPVNTAYSRLRCAREEFDAALRRERAREHGRRHV